jgi:kinetochore protein Mis12/MTW1
MLHAERARNEGLLGELRGLLGGREKEKEGMTKIEPGAEEGGVDGEEGERPHLAFLRDQGGLTAGGAEKPLETTTAFTLSQMQALRELSSSLRSLLPGLGGDGGGQEDGEEKDEVGRKSWRRERMEFVETQTRKHLEQARGLELGPEGEVRDGEWQGEGRGLAREEVEGLERIVGLLGAGNGEEDGTGEEMDES